MSEDQKLLLEILAFLTVLNLQGLTADNLMKSEEIVEKIRAALKGREQALTDG